MALLSVVPRLRMLGGLRGSATMWSVICGLMVLRGADVCGQTPASKEYQVKAVFLFNFAQFVDWPPAAFEGANTPLVIGVLGENPFGAYLDETVRDEKVSTHPLQVQRYRRVDDIHTCHVLFISRSEASGLEHILAGLKDRSIVVVGDADDFVQRGGMIGLATVQNRIRLIINIEAAKAANLTISSKLLRSAEVVRPSSWSSRRPPL